MQNIFNILLKEVLMTIANYIWLVIQQFINIHDFKWIIWSPI